MLATRCWPGGADIRPLFEQARMDSYKSDAESFLSCQKREADDFLANLKRKSDGVIQEYNDAVESFNRRARG